MQLKDNGGPRGGGRRIGFRALRGGQRLLPRRRAAVGFRSANLDEPIRPTTHRRRFDYSLKPSFETFLNDPSAHIAYRVGLAGSFSAFPWRGGGRAPRRRGCPVNTVSTSDVPSSIRIRGATVGGGYNGKASPSAPVFEPGLRDAEPGLLPRGGGECSRTSRRRRRRGRFCGTAGSSRGGSGSVVRKRAPDDPLLPDGNENFHTALLQGRLNLPEIDAAIDFKWGTSSPRSRACVSRHRSSSAASPSPPGTATPTRGSSPIRSTAATTTRTVEIPITHRAQLGKTAYRYSMSPWTRDAAQDIDRSASSTRIGRDVDKA